MGHVHHGRQRSPQKEWSAHTPIGERIGIGSRLSMGVDSARITTVWTSSPLPLLLDCAWTSPCADSMQRFGRAREHTSVFRKSIDCSTAIWTMDTPHESSQHMTRYF